MRLNLSKFKKTAQDDNTATLKHADGHEFRVALKHLNAFQRKSITDAPIHMADGGEVPDVDKGKAKEFEKGFNAGGGMSFGQMVNNFKHALDPVPVPKASPTPVHKAYKDGGLVSLDPNEDDGVPVALDLSQAMAARAPDASAVAAPAHDAPMEGPAAQDQANAASAPPPVDPSVIQYAPEAQRPALDPNSPATLSTPSESPQQALAQAPAPLAAVQQGAQMAAQQSPSTQMLIEGLTDQKHAANMEAAAITRESAAKEIALNNSMAMQAKVQNDFQTNYKALEAHNDQLMKEIQNSKIDPNRLLGSMDTGSKVAMSIGLILGGIGSIHSGHNAAMDYLDKAIDRDIDAQKADLGKKNNLLSYNMQKFNNMQTAMSMTQAQMRDMLSTQIQAAAAKSGGQLAQARAVDTAGKLKAANSELYSKLSAKETVAQLQKQANATSLPPDRAKQLFDAMALVDPAKAKDMQERYVPGYGFATTLQDAKDVKDAASIKNSFDRKIGEMIDLRTKHHGGSVLDREDVARGKQLSKDVMLAYKDMAKLGVLSVSDQKILDAIIPEDPLNFNASGLTGQDPTMHKLKKLRADTQADFDSKLSLRGLTPSKPLDVQPGVAKRK